MSEDLGVQSDDSDQGADESGGFYQEHLNSVPEDYRPHVEPYLKAIEGNANEKFREHAEYRKQWEPYEELNLTEYDPQGLSQLIEFAETVFDPENPEAFKEWWNAVGQQQGYISELADQYGGVEDEEDSDWDEDEGLEGLDLETFKEAINELLDERLAPIQQQEYERQQSAAVEEANTEIDQEIEALKQEYGDFDEQAVYRFAYALSDQYDNPIQAGFQEYQKLVANIENETVNGKLDAPAPPESGEGPANTSIQAPTEFADANRMARERLAQIRQ